MGESDKPDAYLIGYLDSQIFKEFLLNNRTSDKDLHSMSVLAKR